VKRAVAPALAAALLVAACTKVTETEPLPWLRIKQVQYKEIGGFGGRAPEYQYYVKRYGILWLKLEEVATGPAVPLDAETAAMPTPQGLKVLRRGEEHGILACGNARSTPSIVAAAGVIDCVDVVAGPAAAVASQIRWRRISGAGDALVVEKLSVESPGRVFLQPTVTFYDAGHQPYFVTLKEKDGAAPECALAWVAGGEVHTLAAPEGMTLRQCSEAEPWSKAARRTLRHV
jgi:hypothetical protein